MSFYFPNIDPVFVHKRKGDATDPFMPLNESTVKVISGKVVLREVPDFQSPVIVKNSSQVALVKTTNATLLANQFRVDYSVGIVYVHSSLEGQNISVEYTGTGYVSFPAERVWIDGEEAPITLQNLADEARETIDNLVGTDVGSIESKIGSLPTLQTTNKTSLVQALNEVHAELDSVPVVTDSAVNGNVIIDGQESVVYTHPATHPASIITQDANNRMVTDALITSWNAKASTSVATTSANGLMPKEDKTKLNDIDLTNKVDGYALQYDAATSKVVLKSIPEPNANSGATINDATSSSATETWSTSKINTELSNKANSTHKHSLSDLLDPVVKTVNGIAPDANGNVIVAGRVDVKSMGAKGDGSDATVAIQSALNMAMNTNDGIIVEIPDGDYLISNKLRIYRNTHLKLGKNARMLRGSYVSLMVNFDDTVNPLLDTTDTYSGHGNITIEGGIWDGNILNQAYANTGFNAFQFVKARNITFRNMTVKDIVTCHALDMNAIENLTIENNRFIGYKDATVSGDSWYPRDYVEAIQISNLTSSGASGVGVFDGSPCKNVKISNNYFGASGTVGTQAWCVAVGGHGAVHDKFNEDIKLTFNTFDGMTHSGIRNFKFKNTKVISNTFKKCERDISISNSNGDDSTSLRYDEPTRTFIQTGLPQSGSDMIIQGNTFEDTKRSIVWAKGWAKGSTIAKFDGIKFEGNNVRRDGTTYSTGSMFDLTLCKNVTIKGALLNKVYRGILLNNCSEYTLDDNEIIDSQLEGIFATDLADSFQNTGHSANATVINNRLKNIKYNGILLNYTKGGRVTGNTIENAGNITDNTRHGINIAASSDGINVEFNKIKKGTGLQNQYGIAISSAATNIRVGANEAEGKTAPINIAGATNWAGHYTYSTNGTRYKVTLSDAGAPVYTVG